MKTKNDTVDTSQDFQDMVNLLSAYSEAANQMSELESAANDDFLQIIDEKRERYAALQQTLKQTETALEVIALTHPEWFREKQSIKTPYGTVAFRRSSSLAVKNEEASILLLQQTTEEMRQEMEAETDAANRLLLEERATLLERCVRRREELDLEELEKFDDVTLKKLRIARVSSTNFSVKPAKVEMGKSVREMV